MNPLHALIDCRACRLRESCTCPVPGLFWPEGVTSAALMLVAEAPEGGDELAGTSFSGRAGDILKKLLAEADISSAYLTTAVKCTPANRADAEEGLKKCKGWLWQELQLVKPAVVVTLGKLPTGLLLRLDKKFLLKDYLGEVQSVPFMRGMVAPWHSLHQLTAAGRELTAQTIDFFRVLRTNHVD